MVDERRSVTEGTPEEETLEFRFDTEEPGRDPLEGLSLPDEDVIELKDVVERGGGVSEVRAPQAAEDLPAAAGSPETFGFEPEKGAPAPEPTLSEDSGLELLDSDLETLSEETYLAAESPAGITEQRLEALIAPVVERVVERVIRRTFADVAERVIRESIEALKESLAAAEEE